MSSEEAKQQWLARYKSREGRAIARRAWERCQEVWEATACTAAEVELAEFACKVASEEIKRLRMALEELREGQNLNRDARHIINTALTPAPAASGGGEKDG